MPFYVLQITVVALLVHSAYFRPHRTTVLFLLFIVAPSLVFDPSSYEFVSGEVGSHHFLIFPLMNFFGFLFTYFVSLALSVSLARRRHPVELPLVPLAAMIVLFFSFFGTGIELLNERMHWWGFRADMPKTEYFFMWQWRPILSIPPFLALLVGDRRSRWIAFGLAMTYSLAYLGASLYVLFMPGGLPRLGVVAAALTVFWFAAPWAAHRAHRRGWWNLGIPVWNLQFDQPVPLRR